MSKLAKLEEVKADPNAIIELTSRVSDGETLKAVADSWGVPYGRLAEWIATDDELRGKYEGALALWADMEAQSCLSIADDAVPEDVAKARLRIDTRMKLAGKWDRKRYGERVDDVGAALVGGLAGAIVEAHRRLKMIEEKNEPRIIDGETI